MTPVVSAELLQRKLAESERVRRQLAEALRAYRSAVICAEPESAELGSRGLAALAANDALEKKT